MTRYLVTGGTGRLGTELQKHLPGLYPSHQRFDILNPTPTKPFTTLVHLAAYTDVDGAETNRAACLRTNVEGTLKLLSAYPEAPFVFLSTEHVNGQGVYFRSKYLAEELVRLLAPSYLIIRTLFKPNPYPWDTAWINQLTQGDYVDVIAKLIAKEIQRWDGTSKTVYVGTGRKSMYDLAYRTNPYVTPAMLEDPKRPKDYL